MTNADGSGDRYSRQTLFANIGEKGQRQLLDSTVTLIGCGALGTVLANTLVRAGVGHLRIADRDFIERNNLQRQVLFDEKDIADQLPKAEAAARKLRRINPDITIDAAVTDVNRDNIASLAEGADLLLDGTDNFETRFLINDLAVKTNRPWVYGAVIGATGLIMPILPHDTPCLRCVFENAPPPDANPTCDTAGVIGPAVNIVASFQATEAMKILMARTDDVLRMLLNIDVWSGRVTPLNVQPAREKGNCPCCVQGQYDYLEGDAGSSATTLCGRNAVQVHPGHGVEADFERLTEKLQAAAGSGMTSNKYLVRCQIGDHELTVFADGRAIIKGTSDPDVARSLYARYIGS